MLVTNSLESNQIQSEELRKENNNMNSFLGISES